MKEQIEGFLNQTLKITEHFCTNQSNRFSNTSLNELELAFSSQSSSLPESQRQDNTSI